MGGQDQCLLKLLNGWGHLDVMAFLQPLLTVNEVVDTVHHRLHQLDLKSSQQISHIRPKDSPPPPSGLAYLRLSQTVQVGDVKHPAHGGRVDSTRPSLLQAQAAEDLAESRVLGVENISQVVTCSKPQRVVGGITLLSRGSLTWTPALRPVPRLEGHVRM